MGGRTRKLRNQARRTGLTQTNRWDDGAKAPAADKPVVTKKYKKKVKK